MRGPRSGASEVLVVDDGIAIVYDFVRDLGANLKVGPVSPREVGSLAVRIVAERPRFVFVDAWDLVRQQHDVTQSRLATALAVLDQVQRLRDEDRPTVIGYSSMMDRPEVLVPMQDAGCDALFDLADLPAVLPRILAGDLSASRSATPAHFAALGLAPNAEVVLAHRLVVDKTPAWRQVWDRDAPFDKAAQMWIRRALLPLLPTPDGTADSYRHPIKVLRAISGLPVRF